MEARTLASLKPLKASYAPGRFRKPQCTFGFCVGNEDRLDGTHDAVCQTSTNRFCGFGSRRIGPSGQRRPVFRGNVESRSRLFGNLKNFDTGCTSFGHCDWRARVRQLCVAPILFREEGDAPPLGIDAMLTSTVWTPCEDRPGESAWNRRPAEGHDRRRTGRADLVWPFAVSDRIGPVTEAQAFAATGADLIRCVAMLVHTRPVDRH